MQPLDTSGASHEAPFRVGLYGHELARESLLSAVRTERCGQAYLLAGAPDVGKRTLARLLSQALLCDAESRESRPCGQCRVCRLVVQGGYPDLHLVEPPLKIEDVRQLQRELHLSPTESERRVAVLPNIELASPGAANSLLKTLEEPPSAAVLILTTADADAVLDTIRSRCRLIPLRPLSTSDTAAALVAGWGQTTEQAELLARLSSGRLGWAVRAATDETMLAARDTWLDALSAALTADAATRLSAAAELAKSANESASGLTVWLGWWRDLLLVACGLDEPVVNRDRVVELRGSAGRMTVPEIVDGLRAVEDALRRLAANTNPQLTLEVLMLELPT